MLEKKKVSGQLSQKGISELHFLSLAIAIDTIVLLAYFGVAVYEHQLYNSSQSQYLVDILQESSFKAIPALTLISIIELLCLVFFLFYRLYRGNGVGATRGDTVFNNNFSGADALNQYIEYNKKRNEIDVEINRLYRELMHSDISQFVDANRLAFIGQQSLKNLNSDSSFSTGAINYENFLNQFGISKEDAKIREGSAAFLTPFTREGNRIFVTCQTILGSIGILLQKTDNLVTKDDILMNIVLLIVRSEFVLVNIDGRNPNVYYELGIAHAIGKPTILLSQYDYNSNDLNIEVGFDIRQKRIIIYKDNDDLEKQLLSQISMLSKAKK